MLKHQRYVLSRIGFLFQGSQNEFESHDCRTLREGNSLLKEQGSQYLGEQVSLIPHCVCVSCSVMTNSWQPCGLQPTRLLCPWDFPGKSTGVGSHSLLQEIFPTQGSNPGLPHLGQIFFYHLSYQKALIPLWGRPINIHYMPSLPADWYPLHWFYRAASLGGVGGRYRKSLLPEQVRTVYQ